MTNAQTVQVVAPTEPKTVAEWQQNIENFELTLAGPTLEPAIRTAIEKLRADAIQRKFLAEITAPAVKVDAPTQQFVTPKVLDVMPVAIAERLKEWDLKIAEVEAFLKNAPPHHLIPGANTLLAEQKEARARILWDFQNPEKIPVPLPPPPIQLLPEVVSLVQEIVLSYKAEFVGEVVQWFKEHPEWLQS